MKNNTHVTMRAKIPLGSSAHFCIMGTEKATVLPVPVLEPPIQSFPLRISGIQEAWIPVGRLISMLASEATSHGATPSEAKLSFWLTAGVVPDLDELDGFCKLFCFALMREIVDATTGSGFGAG